MSFAIAVIVLVGLGVTAGAGLALASRYFGVEEDPRVEQLCDILPGANCGACGYPGCRGYALALLQGEDVCLCSAGGNETVQKIAEILGVEAGEVVEKVAVVHCAGTSDYTQWRSDYRGLADCHAAQLVQGGPNACSAGCLGLGSCVSVCPESCISIHKGVALVDAEKCIGCGLCVGACPRDIIRLVPKSLKVHVLCNNHDKGKNVSRVCKVGCTACGLCAKKHEGFQIKENLAHADGEADHVDRAAAMVCPSGSILDLEIFSLKELVLETEARKKLKGLQKDYKKKQREAKKDAKAKTEDKKATTKTKDAKKDIKEPEADKQEKDS